MTKDLLIRVLEKASSEEIKGLCKILWPDEREKWNNDIDEIYDRFQWISSTIWGVVFKDKTYTDTVRESAKKVKVSPYGSIADVEIRITQKVLKIAWEKMTSEQREKVEEIKKVVEKDEGDHPILRGTVIGTVAGTLGIIFGPLGWIIGGMLFLLGAKQPQYKILFPAIVYVTALRTKYEKKMGKIR